MKLALKRLCAFVLLAVLMQALLRLFVRHLPDWNLCAVAEMTIFDGIPYVVVFVLAALLSFVLDLLAARLRRLAYRIVLDSAVLGALVYLAVACYRGGMGDGIGGALHGLLIGHYVMLLAAFRLGVHLVTWRANSRDKAIGDVGANGEVRPASSTGG